MTIYFLILERITEVARTGREQQAWLVDQTFFFHEMTGVHTLHRQERCGCQRQSESSFLHERVNTNDPSGFLPLGLAGSSFICLPGSDQFATEPVTMT